LHLRLVVEVILQRREFFKQIGTVTILVAGGRVWRARPQSSAEIGEGPAFEPWRSWRADSQEGLLALVHAAILSSNAFNTQPWLFTVTSSAIKIYADTARNLGEFDPYLREMFFSIGCALENLLLAARANGLDARVTMLPGKLAPPSREPKPELAVRIELSSGNRVASELFDAIPHRHTNRGIFDASREIPVEFIHSITHVVREDDEGVRLFLFVSEGDRKQIADVIWEASRNFMADPAVGRGTKPWYRSSIDDVHRDGAYIGDPDPASYVDSMMSGRLFGLIAVRDRYDRPQTIRAGRVWQRAHLLATARDIAARPANGAVEIIDHEKRLHLERKTSARLAQLTADISWQPTFMFYMGYPTRPAAASARRGVHDVLI